MVLKYAVPMYVSSFIQPVVNYGHFNHFIHRVFLTQVTSIANCQPKGLILFSLKRAIISQICILYLHSKLIPIGYEFTMQMIGRIANY